MSENKKSGQKYFAELIRWVEDHPGATLQEYQKARDKLREKHSK